MNQLCLKTERYKHEIFLSTSTSLSVVIIKDVVTAQHDDYDIGRLQQHLMRKVIIINMSK